MNIPFQWLFAQFGGWSFSIAESHASRDKSPCFCVWLRYLDAIKTCAFRLPCHIPAGGGYGPDGKGSLVIQHGWRIIEDQITWTTQHLFFFRFEPPTSSDHSDGPVSNVRGEQRHSGHNGSSRRAKLRLRPRLITDDEFWMMDMGRWMLHSL